MEFMLFEIYSVYCFPDYTEKACLGFFSFHLLGVFFFFFVS